MFNVLLYSLCSIWHLQSTRWGRECSAVFCCCFFFFFFVFFCLFFFFFFLLLLLFVVLLPIGHISFTLPLVVIGRLCSGTGALPVHRFFGSNLHVIIIDQ